MYEEEVDLFYEDCSEKIIEDDTLVRLIAMPNVIVASHQAFLTKEALRNIAAITVENLLKLKRAIPPRIRKSATTASAKKPAANRAIRSVSDAALRKAVLSR